MNRTHLPHIAVTLFVIGGLHAADGALTWAALSDPSNGFHQANPVAVWFHTRYGLGPGILITQTIGTLATVAVVQAVPMLWRARLRFSARAALAATVCALVVKSYVVVSNILTLGAVA